MKKWIKGFFPSSENKIPKASSHETQKAEKNEEGWTEAEAEIVNQLINMDSLIKISKHLNDQEYSTLSQINETLCQENIDLSEARKSLLGGLQAFQEPRDHKYLTQHLPFQYYSVRSLLWKILLGHLSPNQKEKWISQMEKHLSIYKQNICNFIVFPIEKKLGLISIESKKHVETHEKQKEYHSKDHPLSFSNESKWGNYFKDVELWTSIEKDIKRTRRNCKFFEEPNEINLENEEILLKSDQITFSEKKIQTYSDCLTRLLFIYLKNHPGECYYQGMNEIAAIVFYSLTNKNSEYFRRVSESDSYFMFELIMSRLPKKHFQKGEEYVKDLLNFLKKLDLRLYEHIQEKKLEETIKMVTMKWFLSGFLTEFSIDDCIIIWDCFIGWPVENVLLTDCFIYMALSLVHMNRQKIVDGENIALIFSKITNEASEVVEKTQSLYKLFPKLLER